MPINFQHEMNPLISGAMAYLGGYGVQQGKGSAVVADQATAMNQQAAQERTAYIGQMSSTLGTLARDGLQQKYRMQLADQQNTYELGQLRERGGMVALDSANQSMFQKTGAFLVAPPGAPPDTPTFANSRQPDETFSAFVDRRGREMNMNANAARMQENGYEYGYTDEQTKQLRSLESALDGLPGRVAMAELEPGEALYLEQQYQQRIGGIQKGWHQRQSKPQDQVFDVPDAPGWKGVQTRSGARLYDTNPKPTARGKGAGEEEVDLGFIVQGGVAFDTFTKQPILDAKGNPVSPAEVYKQKWVTKLDDGTYMAINPKTKAPVFSKPTAPEGEDADRQFKDDLATAPKLMAPGKDGEKKPVTLYDILDARKVREQYKGTARRGGEEVLDPEIADNLALLLGLQPQRSPSTQPSQGPPAVGMIDNGYRYKGGDPNDRNSWEKVQ